MEYIDDKDGKAVVLYFPLQKYYMDSVYNWGALDTAQNMTISKALVAMHEPNLSTYAKLGNDIFRFTLMRHKGAPEVYRVNMDREGMVSLYTKSVTALGNDLYSELTADKFYNLNYAYWETLDNRLSDIDFWEMNATSGELFKKDDVWVYEYIWDNGYQLVTFPVSDTTDYRCAPGKYLQKLSREKTPVKLMQY